MSSDRPVTQIEAGVFVGREAELRQLHNAFDSAASGAGSLAMVVGEPGIGKTTLCQQLAAHAEQQGATLVRQRRVGGGIAGDGGGRARYTAGAVAERGCDRTLRRFRQAGTSLEEALQVRGPDR